MIELCGLKLRRTCVACDGLRLCSLSLSRSQHNHDEGKLGKTSQCELHSAAPKKILPPPLCTWIFCSRALHSKLKLQFDKHRDICATGSCTGLVWLQAEEKTPPPASILWIFVKMGKRNQTICTFEPTGTKLSGCVADMKQTRHLSTRCTSLQTL